MYFGVALAPWRGYGTYCPNISFTPMLSDANLDTLIDTFESGRVAGLAHGHAQRSVPQCFERTLLALWWSDGFDEGSLARASMKAVTLPLGSLSDAEVSKPGGVRFPGELSGAGSSWPKSTRTS